MNWIASRWQVDGAVGRASSRDDDARDETTTETPHNDLISSPAPSILQEEESRSTRSNEGWRPPPRTALDEALRIGLMTRAMAEMSKAAAEIPGWPGWFLVGLNDAEMAKAYSVDLLAKIRLWQAGDPNVKGQIISGDRFFSAS